MSQHPNADASFFKEVTPKPGPMTLEQKAESLPPQHVDASFYDHSSQNHPIKKESHKESKQVSHDKKPSTSGHSEVKGAHDGFPVMDKPVSKDPTDLKNDLHKHQITDLTHAQMVKESLRDEGNYQAASHVEQGLLERKQVKATELKNDLHQYSITDLTHAQMVKESLNEEGQYKNAKKIDEGLKEKKKVKETELKNDLHQHEITDLTHAQMVKENLNEDGEYRKAKQIDTKNLKEGKEEKKHKVDARFEDSHAHIEGVTKVPGGIVDTKLQQLEQKLGSGSDISPRHRENSQDKKREGSELKKEKSDKKPKVDAKYEVDLTDTIPRVVDERRHQLEEKLAPVLKEKSKEIKNDKGPKDELLKEASKDKSLKASRDPSYETSQLENEKAEKKKAKEADARYEQHKKEATDSTAPVSERIYAGAQMLGDSIEGVGHRVAGVYYQQGAAPENPEKSHDAGKIEKKAHEALDAKHDQSQEKRSALSQPVEPAEAVGNRDKQEYTQKIFTSELGWDKPVDKVKPVDRSKSAAKPTEKAELQDPDQPLSRSGDHKDSLKQSDSKNWELEEKLKAKEADERYEQHKHQLADPDQPFINRLSAGVQMVGDTLEGAHHRVQETVAHLTGQSK